MHLVILLIGHFLGDFLFQSNRIAQQKNENINYLYFHWIIYSIVLFVLMLLYESEYWLILFLVVSLSHLMIDYFRINLLKKNQNNESLSKIDLISFIFDQVIHLLIILILSFFITGMSRIGSSIFTFIFSYIFDKYFYNGLVLILLIYICITPSAILIKKVLAMYVEDENSSGKKDLNKSGYLIGILERIIMLMLGLSGQVGAIGFVIAAKSLARFKQLEDKDFAERYLLGTLVSVLIALVCIIFGNSLIN